MGTDGQSPGSGRLADLTLFLYVESLPEWPANGRGHATVTRPLIDVEAIILADGHAVRLRSGDRILAEFVRPKAPGATPVAKVPLDRDGGFFANDWLLYECEHRLERFPTPEAFALACRDAEARLASDGATPVGDATKPDRKRPLLAVVPGEHEVEVRALYRDPAARSLLRVTSRLGLKLKQRR